MGEQLALFSEHEERNRRVVVVVQGTRLVYFAQLFFFFSLILGKRELARAKNWPGKSSEDLAE